MNYPLDKESRKELFQTLIDDDEWIQLTNFRTQLMRLSYYLQKGKCYFCQVQMLVEITEDQEQHPDRMTREHLIPKSLGGQWNEKPALSCYLCNHKKGQMDEFQFIESPKFEQIIRRRAREGVYGPQYVNKYGQRKAVNEFKKAQNENQTKEEDGHQQVC